MRIMVLSNLFPPHHVGGYELGCAEMVAALRGRGHDVCVLTGATGGNPRSDLHQTERVVRLHPEGSADCGGAGDLWRAFSQELRNQRRIGAVIRAFRPDVTSCWNLAKMPMSTVFFLAQRGVPVCYYVFDEWLLRWQRDPWCSFWIRHASSATRKRLKRLAGNLFGALGATVPTEILPISRMQFASAYLKRSALSFGLPVDDADVVPWGVDMQRFATGIGEPRDARRLLFAGQVMPHKGVHTAIAALGLVNQELGNGKPCHLTIAGPLLSDAYLRELRGTIRRAGLDDQVDFVGPIEREKMPAVYGEHGILLFPSTWEEPFGIVQIEAMAAGMCVISTGTGGAAEIVRHGDNGVIVPREDPEAMASAILRLASDVDSFNRLRSRCRAAVDKHLRFEATVDAMEQCLRSAADVDV